MSYLQSWVVQELDRHSQSLWQDIRAQHPGLNEPVDPLLNAGQEGDVAAVHIDVEAEGWHFYQRYLQKSHMPSPYRMTFCVQHSSIKIDRLAE